MKDKGCQTCLYIGNPPDAEPCQTCILKATQCEVFSGWRSQTKATAEDVRMVNK